MQKIRLKEKDSQRRDARPVDPVETRWPSGNSRLLTPISEQTAGVQAIVSRLRTGIDLGFFADGELLPKEATLAAELKVSVFALREALAVLRSEGLVVTKAGRGGGTLVRNTSLQQRSVTNATLCELSSVAIRDLADWREMIDSETARLAARRASAVNIARLEEYAQRLGMADTQHNASRARARFDLELAAASQSVRLSSAQIQIYEEFGWLLSMPHADTQFREFESKAVRGIVENIRARNTEMASGSAREHARRTFDYLIRHRLALIAAQEDSAND